MKCLVFALTFLASCAYAKSAADVRDADTIIVEGITVRLQGVDAPELKTKAGQAARNWMIKYLSDKIIQCNLTGQRSYDRYIGVCYADGKDIGAAVLQAGHALDCQRYSGWQYQHLETSAAQSRIRRASYCR